MTSNDYQLFSDAWINAHAISSSNQVPSDGAVSLVFDVLSQYPIDQVLSSLHIHCRKSRFAPTPADVCEIIDSRTGGRHLDADEAWAIVIRSFDESETVVMTQQMLDARAVAADIYQDGDEIGARMAFKSSYSRLIELATDRPRWVVSLGSYRPGIEDSLSEAVRLGRISVDRANSLLPGSMDGGVIGGLLTGKIAEPPADNKTLKERWHIVKEIIINNQLNAETFERMERERKRLEMEQKKKEALYILTEEELAELERLSEIGF